MSAAVIFNRSNHVWRLNSAKKGYKIILEPSKSAVTLAKEELQEFLEKTDIPGLTQIFNHKSWFWRIIWTIVIICGCIIAVYQSFDVLKAFLNHSVVQVISFSSKHSLIFPAVTVCANMLIDYNTTEKDSELMNITDKMEKEVNESSSTIDIYELQKIINKYRTMIMTRMLKYDEEVLKKMYGNEQLFQHCNFLTRSCNYSEDFYSFYKLSVGKCMTFNPGFKQKKLEAGANQGLLLVLNMNLESRARVLNADHAILIVHPFASPPISNPLNIITVYPGESIQIFLQGKSIHRSGVQNYKPCVHERVFPKHENYPFLTPESPYAYSVKACIAYCHLRKLTDSNCVDPNFEPRIVREELNRSKNGDLCTYSDYITETELPSDDDCKCPIPCKSHEISLTTMKSSLIKKSLKYVVQNEEGVVEFANKISSRYAVIQVTYENTEYMRISDEAQISAANFFGTCGGNLSLWVGIDMLFFMELAELFVLILRWKISFIRSKTTKQSYQRRPLKVK